MNKASLVKVHVFVPADSLDVVLGAIGKTGANRIGHYDYCSFVTEGRGYFRPLEGANPTIGRVGEVSNVREFKVEFICPLDRVDEVKAAIHAAHPYEEVPLDVFPLLTS